MRASKSSGVSSVHEGDDSMMDFSADLDSTEPLCNISSNIVPR